MRRIFLALGASLTMSLGQEPPSILLICVDDLRPELACYGKDYIHSPHIDALAKRGVLFENHYVQAPTCGASRYAFLTGLYGPPGARGKGNGALFARAGQLGAGDVSPSLPAWFRSQGYTTVSVGKVSHHPGGRGGRDWDDGEALEMPNSWDRHLLPAGPWLHPRGWMHGLGHGAIRKSGKIDVFESEEGLDSIYPDGVMLPVAVEQLQLLAKEEKPFFLAVGILRPHLPFGAPKKYLDRYQGVALPEIAHPEKPQGKTTWHGSKEFMKYHRWGKDPNADHDFANEVRRHYAACVSYADAMVGQILSALEETGEKDNTIVVLWGDHGWHLGEHAVWGKHTLFEESLRAPLLIAAPQQGERDERTSAIVQSVDIFPTLCDLAGLAIPPALSGRSLKPLLNDCQRGESRGFAYAYYGGKETLRTSRYRYIEHEGGECELYDLASKEGESRNIALEELAEVARLRAQLASVEK